MRRKLYPSKRGLLGGLVALFVGILVAIFAVIVLMLYSVTANINAEKSIVDSHKNESHLGISNTYDFSEHYDSLLAQRSTIEQSNAELRGELFG